MEIDNAWERSSEKPGGGARALENARRYLHAPGARGMAPPHHASMPRAHQNEGVVSKLPMKARPS